MTPSRVITSVRRTARAAAGILVDNFCPFWGLGCPKRGLKNGDTIVQKAAAFLKINTEEASFINKKEVEELKNISDNLEKKLETIDFSKIDDPQKLISEINSYLQTASNFTSKLHILDKVKIFLNAVSHGESLTQAFKIAFKNPLILNKLANSIKVDLEQLNENSLNISPKKA
ncbi:MAG: hypothetical protein LEGION0398_MBIBDBAK_01350 [Legionellaceae bacterium]